MKTLEEIKEKIVENLSWDKIIENLPTVLLIAIGVYILDKAVDIESKIKPLTETSQRLSKAEVFEALDTIGDYIQVIDLGLKQFGISMNEVQLKKIADFLQNIGAAGKIVTPFIDAIKGKLGRNPTIGKSHRLTQGSTLE